MRLLSCIHPITREAYTFPTAQAHLTVPNARKNPVFVVPGGGGPINPKGGAPFDRDVNLISYQCRIFPQHDGQTLTDARNALLRAVDHGLPQTLIFLDDGGQDWQMRAALTRDPYEFTTQSDLSVDLQLEWVALSDLLAANPPGAVVFGNYFKFGNNAKFGASYPTFALTTGDVTIALDNSATGASATTSDAAFSFVGPYGPAAPSETDVLVVAAAESGTYFWLPLNLLAGETLVVDLASRRVIKNGQPIFGLLRRPPLQRTFLDLLPNTVNHIQVYCVGATLATLNGAVTINWKPKKGF